MWSSELAEVVRCALVIVGLLLAGCSKQQTLVVSDYGYYLDGVQATSLNSFSTQFRAADPIELQACPCADTKRVLAAIDWLKRRRVAVISIGEPPEGALCGVCR